MPCHILNTFGKRNVVDAVERLGYYLKKKNHKIGDDFAKMTDIHFIILRLPLLNIFPSQSYDDSIISGII